MRSCGPSARCRPSPHRRQAPAPRQLSPRPARRGSRRRRRLPERGRAGLSGGAVARRRTRDHHPLPLQCRPGAAPAPRRAEPPPGEPGRDPGRAGRAAPLRFPREYGHLPVHHRGRHTRRHRHPRRRPGADRPRSRQPRPGTIPVTRPTRPGPGHHRPSRLRPRPSTAASALPWPRPRPRSPCGRSWPGFPRSGSPYRPANWHGVARDLSAVRSHRRSSPRRSVRTMPGRHGIEAA